MHDTSENIIDWSRVRTVLLDMDGTLLDLYFDSYLWKEHLPLRYAQQRGMDVETAKRHIVPRIRALEGTLKWYCLDHWTAELGIDISSLEREVAHLIALRPYVSEFLHYLQRGNARVVLTTNAHRRSLDHKLSRTGIGVYFDEIVSSHDFGVPKEDVAFWQRLQNRIGCEPASTLLIDDNPNVLRAARMHGIAQLLAVALPDSRGARRQHQEFHAVESFLDLLPAAERNPAEGKVADRVSQT